ncbi:MAG: hypothetical protein JRG95_17225 [Deltaproteobacteria bacterium]|nr:hypothetical protein [Deltaproteobacteria bacterium]
MNVGRSRGQGPLAGPSLALAVALLVALFPVPTQAQARRGAAGKAEKIAAPASVEKVIKTGGKAKFEVATRIDVTYDIFVSGVGKFDPRLSIDDGTTWIDDPLDPTKVESAVLGGDGFAKTLLIAGNGGQAGKFKLDIVERSSKAAPTSFPGGSTNRAGGARSPPPASASGPGRLRVGGSLPGSVPPGGRETYELETQPYEEYQIVVRPRAGSPFDAVITPEKAPAADVTGQGKPETYTFVAKGKLLRFEVSGRGGGMGTYDVSASFHVARLQVGKKTPGSVRAGQRSSFQLQTEKGETYHLRVLADVDNRFDPVVTVSGQPAVDRYAAGKAETVEIPGDGSLVTIDVRDRSQASGQFEIEVSLPPTKIVMEESFRKFPPGKTVMEFPTRKGVPYFIYPRAGDYYTLDLEIGGKIVLRQAHNKIHRVQGTGAPIRMSVQTHRLPAPRSKTQQDPAGLGFFMWVQEAFWSNSKPLVVGKPQVLNAANGSEYDFKFFARANQYTQIHVKPHGRTDPYIVRFSPPGYTTPGLRHTNRGSGVTEIMGFKGQGAFEGFRVGHVGPAGPCTISVVER